MTGVGAGPEPRASASAAAQASARPDSPARTKREQRQERGSPTIRTGTARGRRDTISIDAAGADDPFVALNMFRLTRAAAEAEAAGEPTTAQPAREQRAKRIRTDLTIALIALTYAPATVPNLGQAVPLLLDAATDEALGWDRRIAALRAILNVSRVDRLRHCLTEHDAVYVLYSLSNGAPRDNEARAVGLEILANLALSRRSAEDMVTQGEGREGGGGKGWKGALRGGGERGGGGGGGGLQGKTKIAVLTSPHTRRRHLLS